MGSGALAASFFRVDEFEVILCMKTHKAVQAECNVTRVAFDVYFRAVPEEHFIKETQKSEEGKVD